MVTSVFRFKMGFDTDLWYIGNDTKPGSEVDGCELVETCSRGISAMPTAATLAAAVATRNAVFFMLFHRGFVSYLNINVLSCDVRETNRKENK